MNMIIILGGVLVLGILYMIFRISGLMEVAKGKKDDNWNNINAMLFMVFMISSLIAFFYYSYKHFDSYDQPVASVHGKVTDNLFWITMAITVFAFTIIFIAMFWFTYRYRYDKNRRAAFFSDNHYLEFTWTVIPAIVLTLLIIKGLNAWSTITSPAAKDAEVIEMIGQQFAWTARYPGLKDKKLGHYNYKFIDASNEFGLDLTDKNSFDDFKSLTLYLPKGKEVLLKIRAKDVLHSVFLPHFRVKMDAVPGMETQFKFTPTKTTEEMRAETGNSKFNYEMACTEICGRGHFSMRFPVVVLEPQDYEKWMTTQESWLKQNPDYMKYVPDNLKEIAAIKAGLPTDGIQSVNSVTLK